MKKYLFTQSLMSPPGGDQGLSSAALPESDYWQRLWPIWLMPAPEKCSHQAAYLLVLAGAGALGPGQPTESPWASHTHHGKETPPYPAHIPELGSLWTCTWGDKEAWHCGARLPGIMGTADGFGRRRVAARRAGATGGGGGSGCSSRATVAPRVGRHAPSAKTRRKASGTWTRKGDGLQVVFG